ncbi:MAG: ABC transporter permease [Syntrophobacteraceae bacterium]
MNMTEQQTAASSTSYTHKALGRPERTSQGSIPVTVIEPHSGWRLIDWKELHDYRDLFRFLVWREIRVRYAQSAVGIGWAVIQPVVSMLIFTIIFGRLADVPSDGVPYAVFNLSALVLWTYFSNALTDGINCLASNVNMLTKIYFPRMLMPMSAVAARLLDFCIGLVILAVLMAWYRIVPTWYTILLPLFVALMVLTASGLSMWLSALAIQYRDVKHAMSFIVQILMYAAPVVYPASLIPKQYQLLYALNPMVGVIEGFRAALLSTRAMPWDFLAVGAVSAVAIACLGMLYFRRRERLFADVA